MFIKHLVNEVTKLALWSPKNPDAAAPVKYKIGVQKTEKTNTMKVNKNG